MTRKLLPFEHDLIAALGITKEEYLEFLAIQAEYADVKIGSELDIRNDAITTAVVLTVIGILFQVGATLLMPRPQVPQITGGIGAESATREQRFAPRYGFNSVQELAKYGDTIPIVYTDRTVNSNGGVRVAGSLLWSAIRSFGQNQYLQMLTMLAGGGITAINPNRTAFGQTVITDLVAQNKWMYFRPSATGPLRFQDETALSSASDPVFYGSVNENPYRIQLDNSSARYDGFSQVYSPTSSNTFGGYSPTPFAVCYFLRDTAGGKYGLPIAVYLKSTGFDYALDGHTRPLTASSVLGIIPVGATLQILIEATPDLPDSAFSSTFNAEIWRASAEVRRGLASQFDDGGIFKLGSALFRVTSTSSATVDSENCFVNLDCIEAGRAPSIPYNQQATSSQDVPEISPELRNADPALIYLKNLARIETASYSSLSRCNVIDFALKCQVYRRISGRQRNFGYPANENGVAQRSSMFLVRYRINKGTWEIVSGIFVVRRAAEQDNYVYLKFISTISQLWEVKFEPIVDPIAEITKEPKLKTNTNTTNYFYLENTGDSVITSIGTNLQMSFTGYSAQADQAKPLPPINTSPSQTNEWDWFSYDSDTDMAASFDRGPEFSLVAVTEQQLETFNLARLYKNISLFGFNVFSGKGLQDMRSFTAFVTQGKSVRRLNTSTLAYPATPDGPTCFAPDVFLDTVIDSVDGIGNYADIQGIDVQQLAITKRFCQANNLFFDGLIADRTSWRSFWASTAPFSLLEFARIGGRETLVPAVPYDRTTGAINRTVAVTALFNQGNILEDSYKEEYMDYDANVQDIIATVIYRALDNTGNFALNRSVSIQRSDTVDNDAVLQTFDLSAYVTTEAQAILFGKLMCNTRRYVRSSIEFKTYPTTSPVSPGAYIYVDIGQNNWDNIYTGTVGPGGVLNTPVVGNVPNGTYNILLYRSGNDVISTTATISNNTATGLSDRDGWLFVLGQNVRSKRVFRVSEVQMDEEGEVTVRATIYPCDSSDRSLIADFSDNLFTVRS